MNKCKSGKCSILLTFANSCAMAARPRNSNDENHWVLAVDKNPKEAIVKAVFACEQKYGKEQCGYAENPKTPEYANAFCSGYDYESYEQK